MEPVAATNATTRITREPGKELHKLSKEIADTGQGAPKKAVYHEDLGVINSQAGHPTLRLNQLDPNTAHATLRTECDSVLPRR